MYATSDLDAVEVSIEDAKKKIALFRALEKLQKNKDFKLLINTGYLENEAIRLVHLKSDFNMTAPEQQEFIDRAIVSIGNFRSYLSSIYQQGHGAIQALEDHEQTREAILAEELQNGDD